MTTAPQDAAPDTTSTSAGGHRFTLTSAADATNTSKRTILRHMDDLTRHGASKDETGAWSIPIAALLAAGFKVGAPRTPEQAPEHAPTRTPDNPETLRAELAAVRAALLDAQHRADLAQALAAERAHHIANLQIALRALPAAPQPTETPPPKRRWWQRRITAPTYIDQQPGLI